MQGTSNHLSISPFSPGCGSRESDHCARRPGGKSQRAAMDHDTDCPISCDSYGLASSVNQTSWRFSIISPATENIGAAHGGRQIRRSSGIVPPVWGGALSGAMIGRKVELQNKIKSTVISNSLSNYLQNQSPINVQFPNKGCLFSLQHKSPNNAILIVLK